MTVSFDNFAKELRLLKKAYRTSGLRFDDNLVVADGEGAGSFFYLYDVNSNSLFVLSTIKNSLKIIKQETSSLALAYDDIVDAFEDCFDDLLILEKPIGQVLLKNLCNTICMYMLGTDSYHASQEAGLRDPCFIILRYQDVSNNASKNVSIVRTLLLSDSGPMGSDVVAERVNRFLLTERIDHPYRFATANVIPFRVENQTTLS